MGSHIVKEAPREDVPLVRSRHVIVLLFVFSVAAYATMASPGDSQVQPKARARRSVFKLCQLIQRYTGRSCLNYNGYGCYCGMGTSTANPVDAVDRCCQTHDRCYDRVVPSCLMPIYFTNYRTNCNGGICRCTDSSPCGFNKCQCDLNFAQCLRSATYNPQFQSMPRSSCHG